MKDLVVRDNLAYVAAFTGGFRVVDFQDPSNPTIIGGIPGSSPSGFVPRDVALSFDFALSAEQLFVHAVPIVAIDVPQSPVFRDILELRNLGDYAGTGIAVTNQFVYETAESFIVRTEKNGTNGNTRLFIGQYRAVEDTAGIPPVVSIAGPTTGTTVIENENLLVTVAAVDDVAVAAVELIVNGQTVFTDTAEPYAFNLTVPAGVDELRLQALAIDVGNNASLAEVSVTVIPDPPPTIEITSPQEGLSLIEGQAIFIGADAFDNRAVTSVAFTVDGAAQPPDTQPPYGIQTTVPTGIGLLTIEATATDNLGQTTTDVVTVVVIADPGTTAVGLVVDGDGNPVSGASVTCLDDSDITDVNGSFSIPGLPTIRGAIRCSAAIVATDGTILRGRSALLSPVPGSLTDFGTITVTTAPLKVLYGAAHSGRDGPSTLFIINHETGQATEVGPIGFERVGAMDFDPATETLIATGERQDGSDANVLIVIDPSTGRGTEIGPTGVESLGFGRAVADISFRNADGVLYAYLEGGDGLGTIDPLTGAASALGDTDVSCCGNGMAFSPEDILLHSNEDALHTLDQTSGLATFLAEMSFSRPAEDNPRINAMDYDPETEVLFGSLNDGFGGNPENYLATIDPSTGETNIIGPTADGLDALAWVSGVDSDGDGLFDKLEAFLGTDPNNADTDGDGLFDGFEVTSGFDPLTPGEDGEDPDGDGLDNLGEQAAGTDPSRSDTDEDGLSDGDEVALYGTNPTLADSDSGGRSDGREVLNDGTDPLDGSDDRTPIKLTDATGISDQAMPAVDPVGNVHVVWVDDRSGNDEIFYTMLSPAGVTLIEDTALTNDPSRSKRPAIAIDNQGLVHVVWQDRRLSRTEIFHRTIDPDLDDQDGSPAERLAITLVDDHVISTVDSSTSNHPRLAVDSQGRVHVVWSDENEGEVHYARLNADGTVAVADRTVFTGGMWRFRTLPSLSVDSNDDVHIVWNERRGTDTAEIFYAMLDGETGATLIDSTLLTPDDGFRGRFPSIGVGPRDEVTVVFQDLRFRASGGETEIFMRRIDPSVDDHNGDPADVESITVLPETLITPDDGRKSNHPTATVDPRGNVHLTNYDDIDGSGARAGLVFRVVDRSGATSILAELPLTEGPTATTTTEFTVGFVAVDGPTSYITWTDDGGGQPEVLLDIINPDPDRDGLPNRHERLLGLDRNDPDTDGDGTLDGAEDADEDGLENTLEISSGLDPSDGSDALADFDADGLTNAEELARGTGIFTADSDHDGLEDGEEVISFGTSPIDRDTDGGGRTDGEEVSIDGTDPLDAGDDVVVP